MHKQKYCRECNKETPWISGTKGYRDYCNVDCRIIYDRKTRLVAAIKRVEDFGFIYHDGYTCSHSKVKVTSKNCNHTFIATYLNLFTNSAYCPDCGTAIKKNKIVARNKTGIKDRDYKNNFKEYRKIVNRLTRNVYIKYKTLLNPNDLPLAKLGSHLNAHNIDHIISAKYCFVNDIPPELCASVENLRVMPALDNMMKYSKLTEDSKRILSLWFDLTEL